jgi:hypothetical protein
VDEAAAGSSTEQSQWRAASITETSHWCQEGRKEGKREFKWGSGESSILKSNKTQAQCCLPLPR